MRNRYVKKTAKLLRLKCGQWINVEHGLAAILRNVLRVMWTQNRPDEQFELGFLKLVGCHPNTLTEGIVEYHKRGLSFVLFGVAPDDKWVDVILDMPHNGEWRFYGCEPQTPFEE